MVCRAVGSLFAIATPVQSAQEWDGVRKDMLRIETKLPAYDLDHPLKVDGKRQFRQKALRWSLQLVIVSNTP